jgi:N-formylglutamate amidohydrolase
MNHSSAEESFTPAVDLLSPAERRMPLVFASPHSGCRYPPSFLAAAALDPLALRRSEDSFVDELFGAAPRLGAPLLRALFPRAYLDVNREPWELDPAMFETPLPAHVNSTSPRVVAGLGTIARVVATGAEIYRRKLDFAEAERRVAELYQPYHAALGRLIDESMAAFGCCVLVDCHSMPSIGGPTDSDTGLSRVDFVLGDCFGASCATPVIRTVDHALRRHGYRVLRNAPYAGGFTTRHYGQPAQGVHVLQIEINRRLYMDEASHARLANFVTLQGHLTEVIAALCALPVPALRP